MFLEDIAHADSLEDYSAGMTALLSAIGIEKNSERRGAICSLAHRVIQSQQQLIDLHLGDAGPSGLSKFQPHFEDHKKVESQYADAVKSHELEYAEYYEALGHIQPDS